MCQIFILWLTLTFLVTSSRAQAAGLPTLPPCGGVLADAGTIQSPNYPFNYPNNVRCSWHLWPKLNYTGIRIQFTSFTLENLYDYVLFYDEKNTVRRYTGDKLPPTLFSRKSAKIEFYSDGIITMRGFMATFESINVTNINQCWTSDMFWCTTEEKCISSYWRCDGQPDCTYGEDEFHCYSTTQTLSFPRDNCQRFGSFWCSTSAKCVPMASRCDNHYDCLYHEDEASCSTAPPPEYLSVIVAGCAIAGVILLMFTAIRIHRCINMRRTRPSSEISSNNMQTVAATPSTVWTTTATVASNVGAPNRQDDDPVTADNIPMDRFAPPSYEATMKAYAAGQYTNPRNEDGKAHSS